MQLPDMMTIAALRAAYAAGATPLAVIEEVIARRDALTDRAVFISETPAESLRAEAKRLAERGQQQRQQGGYAPNEGKQPPNQPDERRAFVRQLTGRS